MHELLATRLDPLRPLVDRMAAIHFDKRHPYSACLKASFVRAFELVELAAQENFAGAFFLSPALRAITEDVILLRFLSSVPTESRDMAVHHLMNLEVLNELTDQHSFFKLFRPFQPILPLPPAQADSETWTDDLTLFWRSNGWPKFCASKRKTKPPTREIAAKTDPGMLEVVYDFIYRLTSGVVHFNPRVLLSLGWGKSPLLQGVLPNVTLSTNKMGDHYLAVVQVYGSYLLCLYVELFCQVIIVTEEEQCALADLREHLLWRFRWPEMVAHEEMNLPIPPQLEVPTAFLEEMYTTIVTEGFIAGAKHAIDYKKV